MEGGGGRGGSKTLEGSTGEGGGRKEKKGKCGMNLGRGGNGMKKNA